MYPDLAQPYDTAYHPNFLQALTSQDDRAAALETYMQGDRIHPNAAGVKLIVEDIGPSVLEMIARIPD